MRINWLREPPIKSLAGATVALRDAAQDARRRLRSGTLASRATLRCARKAPSVLGLRETRHLLRRAPRYRSPSYDFRR